MKKLYLFLALAIVCTVTVSCKNKTPINQTTTYSSTTTQQAVINEITYHQFGGDMGLSETMVITQDSIKYSFLLAADANAFKEYKASIKEIVWKELLAACDLNTFAKVKSGTSNQSFDGTDETFIIKTTSSNKFSFTNGEGKEYEQIASFLYKIREQVVICNEQSKKSKKR